ncbi:MAG: YggS family pyridoxal phosphate-dependent enzyme [Clostridia bacterium]|nr:YggS family pyridoxal phosphate-dependent enzyme [Clostridia bacterium]
MSQIKENLENIKKKIEISAKKSGRSADEINLVAVTKTYSPDIINEAIDLGVTDIGENKVQEVIEKYDSVKPVRWHLIGHLQTNKVKYIIDKVQMIHSVDSVKLLEEIERQAKKHNIVMNVLIQVNISGEETKFGIAPDEIDSILEYAESLEYVKVCGLMTIMPKVDNAVSNRLHFVNIKQIYLDISKKKYNNISMRYLSMGMSGDFEVAIEEGSNMVRVGSAIFGQRNYI